MIRVAETNDCLSIAALSIKVWLQTYAKTGIRREFADFALSTFTEEYFLERISHPDYRLLVCVDEDVIQGYALINLTSHFQTADNGFEVEKLYVDSCFQGQGIGTALLQQVAEQFGATFWLYTWVENASNDFYQSLGMSHIGKLTFDFHQWQIDNNVWVRLP